MKVFLFTLLAGCMLLGMSIWNCKVRAWNMNIFTHTNVDTRNSIIGVVMLSISALCILKNVVDKYKIYKNVGNLYDKDYLDVIYKDYKNSKEKVLYSRSLGVIVSDNYVMSLLDNTTVPGIIPIKQILIAYRCNMVEGEPTDTEYIALIMGGKLCPICKHGFWNKKMYEKVLNRLRSKSIIMGMDEDTYINGNEDEK